jgi:hypothetical protein
MPQPSTKERLLVLLLRSAGVVLLLAYAAVFLPVAWMAATHRWLGLGEFPVFPIVDYLTRSISILYGIKGGLYLLLSTDVRRYRPIIVYSAWAAIGFGLAMLVIDARADMPWTWTLGEGPCVILAGAALLVLVQGVPARNGDSPHF